MDSRVNTRRVKKLVLIDGEQVYALRYEVGTEDILRAAIKALVEDKNNSLTAFLGNVLIHQLEQQEKEARMEVSDKAA